MHSLTRSRFSVGPLALSDDGLQDVAVAYSGSGLVVIYQNAGNNNWKAISLGSVPDATSLYGADLNCTAFALKQSRLDWTGLTDGLLPFLSRRSHSRWLPGLGCGLHERLRVLVQRAFLDDVSDWQRDNSQVPFSRPSLIWEGRESGSDVCVCVRAR